MSEEKKSQSTPAKTGGVNNKTVKPIAKKVDNKVGNATAKSVYGAKRSAGKKKPFKRKREKRDDFEQKIVDLARVTRVMGGGKRMRFRACVAVGDKKGKVGIGLAKSIDVTTAINKAATNARKAIIDVATVNDTIPHEVFLKLGAAKILLKPAKKGKGVIAGGVARTVLELAGIKNVTSKILGTNNKVNIVKSVLMALESMKKVPKTPKTEIKEEVKTEKNTKNKEVEKTTKKENK
ncbi:30S ribosomal protein S5 [Candidatus Parcubacteria bacterium]|nr:30S ribosomal protein S5 [Candidatus Parcubacteria bacterium]